MITRKNIAFCATMLVASAALSHASEKAVHVADLPAAVQKTAQEQRQGAVIKRYVKDNEDGKPEYEVEMTVAGHTKDVTIAPDGKLLEVEEQVNLDALPAGVRQSLQKKAGKGTIAKVESITKNSQLVAYEAQVRTAGKHSEIQVGPEGQTLQHEE